MGERLPCLLGRRQWIEARIQAAEEELEMPVVLEEFGSKLDKRCALCRNCHAGDIAQGCVLMQCPTCPRTSSLSLILSAGVETALQLGAAWAYWQYRHCCACAAVL